MMNSPDPVCMQIVCGMDEFSVSTYRNEYRSLMALIRDKLCPDGFGECGGMGRCATCQVQLINANAPADMDRNEQSTLGKYGISDPATRLSCQLLVDAALHQATVVVLDSQ